MYLPNSCGGPCSPPIEGGLKKITKKARKAVKSSLSFQKKLIKAPLKIHAAGLKSLGRLTHSRSLKNLADKERQAVDTATDRYAIPAAAAAASAMGLGGMANVIDMLKPRNPAPSEPGSDNPLPETTLQPPNYGTWLIVAGLGAAALLLITRK